MASYVNVVLIVLFQSLINLRQVQPQDQDEFCRRFHSAKDIWEPSEPLIRGLQTLMRAEAEFTGYITSHHTPYLFSAETMEDICEPILEPDVYCLGNNGFNETGCSHIMESSRHKRQIDNDVPSVHLIEFLDDFFNHFDIDNVFILIHKLDYQGL